MCFFMSGQSINMSPDIIFDRRVSQKQKLWTVVCVSGWSCALVCARGKGLGSALGSGSGLGLRLGVGFRVRLGLG
jgi:hypothetical protein